MEKKYRILRIVATIWKVIGWIVLVVTVLGGCASLVFGLMAGGASTRGGDALGLGLGALSGVVTALIAIFVGVFYFVSLYAAAELIDVMLALEENTRATAEQLKNLKA